MRVHKVDPDFKSFNMMLQVNNYFLFKYIFIILSFSFKLNYKMIPDDLESEELIIKVMKFYKLRPELDFINILMKRRRLRKDMLNFDVFKIKIIFSHFNIDYR
jgi:hypothetical protein